MDNNNSSLEVSTGGLFKVFNFDSILKILISLLLLIALARFIFSSTTFGTDTPFSFSSFLVNLSGMPGENIKDILTPVVQTIGEDWGFFNYLRDFINIFINGIINVSVYICRLIYTLILQIFFLVKILFL